MHSAGKIGNKRKLRKYFVGKMYKIGNWRSQRKD